MIERLIQQCHLVVQLYRAAYSFFEAASDKTKCKALMLFPIDTIPIFIATSIHVSQIKQAMNSKFCLRKK